MNTLDVIDSACAAAENAGSVEALLAMNEVHDRFDYIRSEAIKSMADDLEALVSVEYSQARVSEAQLNILMRVTA